MTTRDKTKEYDLLAKERVSNAIFGPKLPTQILFGMAIPLTVPNSHE
jgi:hypothetical protein